MKVEKHLKKLEKRAKQIEDECHAMFLDGHIDRPDQYLSISNLNLIMNQFNNAIRQAIPR